MGTDYYRLLEIMETYARFCGLWLDEKISHDEFKIGVTHFMDAVDLEVLKKERNHNGN